MARFPAAIVALIFRELSGLTTYLSIVRLLDHRFIHVAVIRDRLLRGIFSDTTVVVEIVCEIFFTASFLARLSSVRSALCSYVELNDYVFLMRTILAFIHSSTSKEGCRFVTDLRGQSRSEAGALIRRQQNRDFRHKRVWRCLSIRHY